MPYSVDVGQFYTARTAIIDYYGHNVQQVYHVVHVLPVPAKPVHNQRSPTSDCHGTYGLVSSVRNGMIHGR